MTSQKEFYIDRLRTLLFLAMPELFQQWIIVFFRTSFASFVYAKQQELEEEEEEESEEGEDHVEMALIHQTCRLLKEIGFMRFIESTLIEILYHDLEKRIERNASGIHDQYFLEPYFEWLNEFVGPWLQCTFLEQGLVV